MTAPVSTFLTAAAFALAAAVNATSHSPMKGAAMTTVAKGPFDVKLTPAGEQTHGVDTLGHLKLEKQFHGALEATSVGEMLSIHTGPTGAAAYVALDHVEGAVDGRRGTFVLQHAGTMSRDGQQLTVVVVPGSGTGELTGLTGTLRIAIGPGGEHSYELEYTLPPKG